MDLSERLTPNHGHSLKAQNKSRNVLQVVNHIFHLKLLKPLCPGAMKDVSRVERFSHKHKQSPGCCL